METKILYMVVLLAFAWPAISEGAEPDTPVTNPGSLTIPTEVTTHTNTTTITPMTTTGPRSTMTTTDKLTTHHSSETTMSTSEGSTTPPSSETTMSTSEGSTTPHSSKTTVSTSEGSTTPPSSESTMSTSEGSTTPHTSETTVSTSEGSTTPHSSKTTTAKSVNTMETTNPTTATPLPVIIYLSYRIVNYEFVEAYYDLDSALSKALNATIEKMYNDTYACGSCPDSQYYEGYTLRGLRPGSVRAYTELRYRKSNNTATEDFVNTVASRLPKESGALKLDEVNGGTTPQAIPPPQGGSTSNVPGWGIALLVLVCILVLFALIAILILLIHWCRRHHRGHLDIIGSQDSYHPMNEYPPYQTHGRYAAPNNKQNPYSEINNGTSPFSYTNPAMANDNL